jgi:hypothetical protein
LLAIKEVEDTEGKIQKMHEKKKTSITINSYSGHSNSDSKFLLGFEALQKGGVDVLIVLKQPQRK